MICFQCGHQVEASAPSCSNCGQVFGQTRKISRTVTSFKALELRKKRLDSVDGNQFLSSDDNVDGRYEVQTFLGQGALGQAYKARDRETGRFAALKVIDPRFYEGASERTMLLEALDSASRHSATRVLRPQLVEHKGLVICQSMFVTGVSLAKLIRQRRGRGTALSLLECYPRITQLNEAIAELYADQPHGLLKPQNVLLIADGIRVTDYGLSHGLSREALIESQRDSGTLAYVAPEVRAGKDITLAADVYSLGAIFAEMVSNLPWSDELRTDERFASRVDNITNADQLIAFVEKATAEDPNERFQSMPSFGAALSAIATEVIDVPPEDDGHVVAPPSTVLLTAKDMPAYDSGGDSPTPEETEEFERIDTYDSYEDSHSEELSGLEFIASVSGDMMDDEAAFLERIPTKVEAKHGASSRSVVERTPTGVIRTRDVAGLGSNRFFFPLLGAIIILGAGSIWALMAYFDTQGSKPGISVSVPTVASPKSASGIMGRAGKRGDAGTQSAVDIKTKTSTASNVQTKTDATSPPLKPQSTSSAVVADTTPNREAATEAAKALAEKAAKDAAKKLAEKATKDAAKKLAEQNLKAKTEKAAKEKADQERREAAAKAAEAKAQADEALATKVAKEKNDDKKKADEPKLACPSGMLLLPTKRFPRRSIRRGRIIGEKAVQIARKGGAYCIDGFEYPGAGSRPRTAVSKITAQGICERKGKRLCTGAEWRMACIGPKGSKYPYGGKTFNPNKCVTENAEGVSRNVQPAGRFKGCYSISGARDMVGNVGEWTADGRVRGGDASGDEDASCNASEGRAPGFASGRVGFRCCADFRDN